MRSVEFFVPGRPVGYCIAIHAKAPRVRAYHGFCERVRLYALQASVRLPLEATERQIIWIATHAIYPTRTFPDPENVHKGVKDALFYRGALGGPSCGAKRARGYGDDRWTGGQYQAPSFATPDDPEGTWVTIEWVEEADKCTLLDRIPAGG